MEIHPSGASILFAGALCHVGLGLHHSAPIVVVRPDAMSEASRCAGGASLHSPKATAAYQSTRVHSSFEAAIRTAGGGEELRTRHSSTWYSQAYARGSCGYPTQSGTFRHR
jgi:hypothetical protein